MANWIERFDVPSRMYLAWQAPDHLQQRFRWAVGEITDRSGKLSLRYFRRGDEFTSLNQGRSYDELKSLGYDGHPAFAIRKETHDHGVNEVFQSRLPPLNRPDFAAYKSQFRIGAPIDLTLTNLLAITEAKLPSDGFSVVDPLNPASLNYDLMLEIAGYRYYADAVATLMAPGRMVDICREPSNPHDSNAIQLLVEGKKVGNVNRLQTRAFQSWLGEASVTAVVERMNGRPGHPRAFVFVRVRPAKSVAAA